MGQLTTIRRFSTVRKGKLAMFRGKPAYSNRNLCNIFTHQSNDCRKNHPLLCSTRVTAYLMYGGKAFRLLHLWES
jgi:hypothetical protein